MHLSKDTLRHTLTGRGLPPEAASEASDWRRMAERVGFEAAAEIGEVVKRQCLRAFSRIFTIGRNHQNRSENAPGPPNLPQQNRGPTESCGRALSGPSALGAVQSRGRSLGFRSTPATSPTARRRKESRAEHVFDKTRHVDIHIQRRPRQAIAKGRNLDPGEVCRRFAGKLRDLADRNQHAATTSKRDLQGSLTRFICRVDDGGRFLTVREALGSRASVTFTIPCGQLFCGHEAGPIVLSAASRASSPALPLAAHLGRTPGLRCNDFARAELDLEHRSGSRNVDMWRRMIAGKHANGETALADNRRHRAL